MFFRMILIKVCCVYNITPVLSQPQIKVAYGSKAQKSKYGTLCSTPLHSAQ